MCVSMEGTCTHACGCEKGSGQLQAQAEEGGGMKRGGHVKGLVIKGGDRVKRQ
jgi:hypothetical protein